MNLLVRIERALAFASSMFIAGAFCLVVLLRYVFDSDLFAYEEWVLLVAFLLYFVGGALASHDDVHIKGDVIQEYIRSARTRSLYLGGVLLLEAAIAAALTYFAARMFVNEFARWPGIPATPVYGIPLAAPRFFIFAGLALMTLHAFLNGYRKVRAGLAMPRATDAPTADTRPGDHGAGRGGEDAQ